MTIAIAAVNALRHAPEIKALFLAHQRPEFPEFFDRAYPPAFAGGATSWLGRDQRGRLVMHIACFPRRFRFGHREVVAGLTGNLMVAQEHRSFFPALALIQRVVQDSRARGDIDFLYADPNEEAQTLVRGSGFAPVGTLRRYVFPVGAKRPHLDLGIRLLHGVVRVVSGARTAAVVVPHPAKQFPAETFGVPDEQAPGISAYHDAALYTSRIEGYPGDRDWWFTGHRHGATTPPEAGLLIRGPNPRGLAKLLAVRRTRGLSLASLLPGLTAELRRRGCLRLQVTTIAESALGRALPRCGFLPRNDRSPLFAIAFTPLGEECLRSGTSWEITDLDCDRGAAAA